MGTLLNKFLAIIAELESYELDSSEDSSLFSVKYSVPLSIIRIISQRFDEVFSNLDVSFELLYERRMDFSAFKQNDRFLNTDLPLDLKLTINKDVKLCLPENTFVFLKTEYFFKHFNALNSELFQRINIEKEIVVHLPIQKPYSNSYLKLFPIGLNPITPAEKLTEKTREEFDLVKKIHDEVTRGGDRHPLPDYYKIEGLTDSFKSWFDQNLFHASLLYIANKVSEGRKFLIRGHKNIEISLSQELIIQNAPAIFNIYRFCYEEKHYNDKIEIARNIFTIYLNSTDSTAKIDELLPKIEKTISNHFSAYIQDSIKKFFNDRKDVVKEAHKFGTDLKAESDKLLTYINTSLLGIITALFSGSLGLSKGERWYLIVALTLHALLFIFSYLFNRSYVEKRKNEITRLYEKYTSKFVVLAEDDLEEIKSIYIEPAVENVNSYLRLYKHVIFGLIAFMILLIAVGFGLPESLFTTSNTKTNNVNAVTNNVYDNKP
ncbi:hypothetical protein GCM10008018_45530 [Paenibacillus marchantiophytorum]|uniref:DUF2207 domain-containing protein n=1 Tax=Paenibacillus marchantiophytorum TaxID=1619310 RepID=A0ABQ1EZT9_9BACL|nr:hypothetical protein [Paenibacillus marchantiophytorum]GFZ93956.1 hypothetical protein GCM10008018_45530 [Paenibacillus marchantiophytorum]